MLLDREETCTPNENEKKKILLKMQYVCYNFETI